MTLPGNVGIIGGGRMGAGIAHAFLVAGTSATVVESSAGAAQAARSRVAARIARAGERGSLLGARVMPPDVLRDKVASGDLGRKTGQGFYAW